MGILNKIKANWKVLCCMVLIGYLCFSPADDYDRLHFNFAHIDKVVHFLMFFGLGLLLWAKRSNYTSSFFVIFTPVFAISYGGIIEIIQWKYMDTRAGDFIDWGADILGIFIAIIIYKYLPSAVKKVLK